jgi:hypothetical protein
MGSPLMYNVINLLQNDEKIFEQTERNTVYSKQYITKRNTHRIKHGN